MKGKQTKTLRAKGVVPAVVYGHGVATRDIELDARSFEKLFERAGESSLIDLAVDGGKPVKVLVQDFQREPLKGTYTHVDLREVRMSEKLDADVQLNFVGESPAVKELGAIFVRNMDTVTVRCLPQYLVHQIDVDVSVLKKFEDSIRVRDLVVPEGIEFRIDPNMVVAVVNEPISEDELKASLATPTTADVSTVKVETEEKKAAKEAAETEKKEE